MRIAFATHAYAPAIGGAERYAQGLAEAIAAQGHDVHVFTPNATSAEVFYEFGYMNSSTVSEAVNGVHVHRVPISYPPPTADEATCIRPDPCREGALDVGALRRGSS